MCNTTDILVVLISAADLPFWESGGWIIWLWCCFCTMHPINYVNENEIAVCMNVYLTFQQ